jgi:hypothetical protein
MMRLDDALTQISEIRQQMAASAVFRGYRPLTTAITAGIACVAAVLQAWLVPGGAQGWVAVDVGHQFQVYLYIWLGAALAGITVVGAEMALRTARSGSTLQKQTTLHAVDQFLPALVAGALCTYVIVEHTDSEQVLPGLWMVFFSLGIFASRRCLPRGAFAVAAYYMLAGLCCLSLERAAALSPLTMGVVFGVGQSLAAGILYWFLERSNVRE